jgi:AcrR family transcriptional regulator
MNPTTTEPAVTEPADLAPDPSGPDAQPSPEPTPRRRGRPRDEGADRRILAAAASLMLDRGVSDITVDEVAEQAGVGKATVYRRYPSKEAMAAEALNTLFRTKVPVPDTGSFRGDMTAVYTDTIRFASSRQGHAFLRLAAGAAGRSRTVADLYREAYQQRRDRFGVVIDRALERGELATDLDRTMFLDWLPALLMFRAITFQPMPKVEDVPDLLEKALRGAITPTDQS